MQTLSLSRRQLLLASTGLVVGGIVFTLASCGTATTPTSPLQAVVSDVDLAIGALEVMVPEFEAEYPTVMSVTTEAKIMSDLQNASTYLQEVEGNLSSAQVGAWMQSVESDFNTALVILNTPPLSLLVPPPYNAIIAAASVIAPELEALVNSYFNVASTSVAASRAKLKAVMPQHFTMTLPEARATLARVNARKSVHG